MKKALASNLIGIWLSAVYVYIFLTLAGGGSFAEPNMRIAVIEFLLSIFLLVWFIPQAIYITKSNWRKF